MSLQFIFGNSGSGKSKVLYDTIVNESIAHPDVNYIVLVPEQFTMQTQKDLCLAHPRKGIMNIDVLSFVRLAHRVFEETGRETKRILDDEGKNLILRRIVGNLESDLTVLKGSIKKPGYISEVKSVISEFTQYGIGPEELDSFMETLPPDSYLYEKLKDIRLLYDAFETYLSDQYITKEELLDVLSDAVPESQILKGSVIALDGFTGFTPVQNRLLGELMKVCRKVIVTVEMDEKEDPFSDANPYQLFGLTKQMVSSLTKIAGQCQVPMDDPIYLNGKPVWRFRENPRLAFLESDLFRYDGRHYEGDPNEKKDAISLHVAQNPKAEAEEVMAKMRRLVREEGYRYRDMAVVVSDMDTYATHLQEAAELYDIPIFMDNKRSILLNAFVEYLRSLLAMVEQNYTYESVFRFLRTGMTRFSEEEVDRMENYVLALGIHGYKKWQEAWSRKTNEVQEEQLSDLNHLRVRFVEMMEPFMVIMRKRKKTVEDITVALYDFFVQEQMQEKIQGMADRFQDQGKLALATEYGQIYRIVLDLMDKFVELLGKETVSLTEYCEWMDAGLEEAKVGVIPPSLDQVVIGDVERTRLGHLKVLFFMGANDTLLPGNLSAGGLLSEQDRELFSKEDLALSPGTKEKTYIQKFYLYLNLTKPSDALFLFFSQTSEDGKSLRPAYLISDLKRLFPDLTLQDEGKTDVYHKEWTNRNGYEYLAEGLRDLRLGLNNPWKEMYRWYFSRDYPMAPLLDAAFYERGTDQLDEETAQALFGDASHMGVTRMEKFSECAYAHFLSYGLSLTERELYEFDPTDYGTVAHQSMERFSKKAQERKMEWQDMPEDLKDSLVNESVEESILDYGNTILFSTARNEYMITRIKKLIRRTVWALSKQMEEGDFKFSASECQFGNGKIDRIDTCEDDDKIYVKVTDYKTGKRKFDISAFYHGLQLQLPVYLGGAVSMEQRRNPDKEVVPAGFFYYQMQDPILEKKDSDESLDKERLKALRMDGLANGDGDVINHLSKNSSEEPSILPIDRNQDGSLGKNAKTLSPEDFNRFLRYSDQKQEEIQKKVASGEADVSPYRLGEKSGCQYCAYRDICGFDERLPGYRYRDLANLSKEEVMEKIRQELKS